MNPVNDNFAQAIVISGVSGKSNGSNVGATPESNEPKNNGATIWWKWICPASGNYFFSLNRAAQTFPGVIQVFSGSVVNGLTEFTYLDDEHYGIGNGLEWGAQVAINAYTGQVCYIRVDSRTNALAAPSAWNPTGTYGPTQAVTYTSAILNNTAVYVARAITQGNQPDLSPKQWMYQGPIEGTMQLNWGAYNQIQLGKCGECPVQFVSAIQQNCIGNGGVSNPAQNAAVQMAYLNANVAGVYQFIACGGFGPTTFSQDCGPLEYPAAVIAWGYTFDLAAAAIGNGITPYATAQGTCDTNGACDGFTGTGRQSYVYNNPGGGLSGSSTAPTFQTNQIALAGDGVFVSQQIIYSPLPFNWLRELGVGSTTEEPPGTYWLVIDSPPDPSIPTYSGQTDYASGSIVAPSCCNGGRAISFQANVSVQGSDIPAGVNPLTGLFNNYWHGGESIPLPSQCGPYNLFGGTFNSGNCGLVYYAGSCIGTYYPPDNLSVNVSYIPMFPNLVFALGGYPYYPNTASQAVFGLQKNLSNQFTWPNVTYQLVPGPNNLTGSGVNVPAVFGNVPPSYNTPGYSNFNFNAPAFPYVLEFEVFMNGILAGTVSYTIQPAVSATVSPYSNGGIEHYNFKLTNSGYGVSENLKFSATCNNSNVKFSTGTLSNQASLTNVALFQYFGTGSTNDGLFVTNLLNGNTPVQFTVTFEDDTFTYPPFVFNITL